MPPRSRRFIQCDVFSSVPTKGNGLAVVVDGDDLTDAAMQSFAAWTNLAETTFLMRPTTADADYRVRIFTPAREMLFAGHPTLGSCRAWLHTGGVPKSEKIVRQECGVGIIPIDISTDQPAFEAPETKIEPLADEALQAILARLEIPADHVRRSARLTNGPVWQAIELASAADVLAVDAAKVRYPEFLGVGLFGAHPAGGACDYEVRMLAPSSGMAEDPITGSLNAAIGRWMFGSGEWAGTIKVAQGTSIGREGRVTLRFEAGKVWVGGEARVLIEGHVTV